MIHYENLQQCLEGIFTSNCVYYLLRSYFVCIKTMISNFTLICHYHLQIFLELYISLFYWYIIFRCQGHYFLFSYINCSHCVFWIKIHKIFFSVFIKFTFFIIKWAFCIYLITSLSMPALFFCGWFFWIIFTSDYFLIKYLRYA